MDTKVCSKCGEEKALEDFYLSDKGLYGRRSHCSECCRAYKNNAKSKSEWYEAGKNSLFRATCEEEVAYPSHYETMKQDFIYNR